MRSWGLIGVRGEEETSVCITEGGSNIIKEVETRKSKIHSGDCKCESEVGRDILVMDIYKCVITYTLCKRVITYILCKLGEKRPS